MNKESVSTKQKKNKESVTRTTTVQLSNICSLQEMATLYHSSPHSRKILIRGARARALEQGERERTTPVFLLDSLFRQVIYI